MDAYVKTPIEVSRVVFDFRDFVADVDPLVVTFELRADLGLGITDMTTTVGLVEFDVTGGNAGRVFVMSVQGTTPDGQSETLTRRVRIVEPATWPDTPVVGTVGGGGASTSNYADNYADNYA